MAKIIFMGTPDFAKTILQGLLESEHQIVAVVTQPDRPVGRKRKLTFSPVKDLALEYDLPVYQPEKISGSIEAKELLELKADLIITAAYGQFVPKSLLEAPKYGAINVHASLLPKYRGGAPIHYAIWQGEQETGISIIYMTSKMDAGDILAQARLSIHDDDDTGSLFIKLADLGKDLLMETLPALIEGKIQAQAQDEELVTFSPTINREQEQLDWQQDAQQIDRHIRAFSPFPSTYTWLDKKRVKIWKAKPIVYSGEQAEVGTIVGAGEDYFVVQAGADTYLAVYEWQPAGKKRIKLKDYFNGRSADELIGQTFETR
ncbi:methionyl-tRNA formyltransferase [Hutsoniella sourekii]|uniref:methionyl-tRNA formyltransferase n=1 Tax=Hutsoniella sourekii TaxID=87650 RepID=UPI000483BADC|nr:methionyl-tRNA formyltransferase [Hutsoniella sourekii]